MTDHHEIYDNIMRNTIGMRTGESSLRSAKKEYGDDEALLRVIRLLIRPYQGELVRRLFTSRQYHLGGAVAQPTFEDLWFDYSELPSEISDALQEARTPQAARGVELDLAKDPILPWPWEGGRLNKTLSFIGKGRPWGPWVYDDSNHYVTIVMPIRVGLVDGGNHSLAVGILDGQGKLPAEFMIDLRPVYQLVYCDGRYYRLKSDNRIISPVTDPIFAAVFEIGRMITLGR